MKYIYKAIRRRTVQFFNKNGFLLVPEEYRYRATIERFLWRFFKIIFSHSKSENFNSYGGESEAFLDFIVNNPKATLVDIGASDGRTLSNTAYAHNQGNGKIIFVENGSLQFAQLAHNYVFQQNPILLRTTMTPGKVQWFIEMFDLKEESFALSLDIDSYDYFVAKEFLDNSRPGLICVEWNPIFPSNVFFTCTEDFERWEGNWFFGASAKAWYELFEHNKYKVEKVCGMSLIAKTSESFSQGMTPYEILSEYHANPKYQRTPNSSFMNEGREDLVMSIVEEVCRPYQGKYVMSIENQ
jgi:hypothetical protein